MNILHLLSVALCYPEVMGLGQVSTPIDKQQSPLIPTYWQIKRDRSGQEVFLAPGTTR